MAGLLIRNLDLCQTLLDSQELLQSPALRMGLDVVQQLVQGWLDHVQMFLVLFYNTLKILVFTEFYRKTINNLSKASSRTFIFNGSPPVSKEVLSNSFCWHIFLSPLK